MTEAMQADAPALLGRWCALGARVSAADEARVAVALALLQQTPGAGLVRALDTAALLAALRLDGDALVAALLAGEAGASLPARVLFERFGPSVGALVEGAARMQRIQALRAGLEPGRGGDRAPQLEALRKMLLAMVQDVRVVLIKLAAEVVRLREVARGGTAGEQLEAARETFELTAPLANRLGVWQLKWELEDLALRCRDPGSYRAIARALDGKRADREAFIAQVAGALREALARAGVVAEVAGRPKHIYSIWKKMQGKALAFEALFDVRAVRVLVEDVKDCYSALGVVHDLWTPIASEFDDYIARPKPNGYRSLHTAVLGPENKTLEVQIRTREMHQASELGVAAHWRYKEGGGDPRLDERIGWLRQILQWRQDMDAQGPAAGVRAAVFQDTVYVLTPQGRVVALPRGATPVDFAYYVHTDLGHRCRGAKVDGVIVPLTHRLESGQRVEIIAAREGGPSRDWLNGALGLLGSARARAKVRQWFHAEHLRQALAQGRALLEREVHRLGVAPPSLEALSQGLGRAGVEDMLAALARGELGPRDLQAVMRPGERGAPVAAAPRAPSAGTGAGNGVLVVGMDRLLTQLARCCKPAPPDAIVGFVTRGRGVSVHRQSCPSVLRQPAERRLAAQWGASPAGGRYLVDLEVTGVAGAGLTRAVTEALGRERVPVSALTGRERTGLARLALTVEVGGGEHLDRVLAALEALPGVSAVRRR
ncbi:MAG: RelA/SpoT family protein [Betaproteobacteria bacterium]